MSDHIVELPDRCVAAAAGGDTVWCAAGGRLLAFTMNGTQRFDVPLQEGVTDLAIAADSLVAAQSSGEIAWLDLRTGASIDRRRAGDSPVLASGGGSVWAVDRSTAQAWKVGEPGVLGAPRRIAGVNRAAADGERLWWVTVGGRSLRDFDRTVDLGVEAAEVGAIAVCAGSVWIGVARGLIRVGVWGGEKGPIVQVPLGLASFLSCADGVLVGASREGRLFVLDPAADGAARILDTDVGPIGGLVTSGSNAWVWSSVKPQIYVIPFIPGNAG